MAAAAQAITLWGAWALAAGLLASWHGFVGGRLLRVPRFVHALRWFGIAGIAIGAVAEVALVLARFSGGGFDADLTAAYLTGTRHGALVVARVAGALAAAIAWAFGAVRIAVALLAFALLALSGASHAGAMGGMAFALDALHLLVAVGWAGALGALAFAPIWHDVTVAARATERIARGGPWLVAALGVSGVLLARLHLPPPASLTATGYGVALLGKLAVVALALVFALHNRRALERLAPEGSASRLASGIRIEAALLAAVLLATAILKTQPPAHAAGPTTPTMAHMRIIPEVHATASGFPKYGVSVKMSTWESANALGGAGSAIGRHHAAPPRALPCSMTSWRFA